MNRRRFFRLLGISAATVALAPSVVVQAAERSLEPKPAPHDYWTCDSDPCESCDADDAAYWSGALGNTHGTLATPLTEDDLLRARAYLDGPYEPIPFPDSDPLSIVPHGHPIQLKPGYDHATVLQPGQEFEVVGFPRTGVVSLTAGMRWQRVGMDGETERWVAKYWNGSAWEAAS